MKFKVVPKNKKLLKSSKVREYFKMVNKKIKQELKKRVCYETQPWVR